MQAFGAQEFFRPGGSLGPNHPSYIGRAADSDLYSKLITGECTCVLNARQMGKTSLKNAAKEKLLARGILLISADLALIGGQLEPDQWYCSLLQEFVRGLRDHDIRPAKTVRNFWLENNHWSPAYRFLRGVEELLLRSALPDVSGSDLEIPQQSKSDGGNVRLILAIDEIDKVRDFAGGWSDDFFAAIRAFYESRPFNPLKSGAGFLLIGVAPPSDLSKGPNSTPFNIGHRIVLTDFTRDEARKLEKGFILAGQSPVRAEALLDSVMRYTGGHPYLTQRLCYEAALMLGQEGAEGARAREVRPSKLIEQACRHCFLDPGIGNNRSDDNLRNVHLQLTKRLEDDRYIISHLPEQADLGLEKPSTDEKREERKAAVLKLYGDVRRGRSVRDDFRSNPWVGYLHFAGVVRSDHGQLRVRNRVYEKVFNRHWVQENMPGRFKRAERTAFYRGLATASAFALLVVIGGLLWWKQQNEVRIRQAEASLRKAEGLLKDFEQLPSAIASISNSAKYHPNSKLVTDTFIEILSRDSLEKIELSAAPKESIVHLWNKEALRHLGLTPAAVPAEWVDFSVDGRYAGAIYADRLACRVTVKDVRGQSIISGEPCFNASLAFDPTGERLGFVSTNGSVNVLSLPDGQRRISSHSIGSTGDPFSPYRIAFNPSPEKRWLALTAASRDHILLWDLQSDKFPRVLRPLEPVTIRDLSWNDKGDQLAAIGERSSKVHIWDFQLDPGAPIVRSFDSTASELYSVQFLPGGRLLAGIGPEGILFLWNAEGALLYDNLAYHNPGPESRIVRLKDGIVGLVSANEARFWRFKPSPVHRSIPIPAKPQSEVVSLELDSSGRVLLVAGVSWLTLINVATGDALNLLHATQKINIKEAAFSSRNGDLLVTTEDGLFHWRHENGATDSKILSRFAYAGRLPRPRGMTAVAISADETQLAMAHPSIAFQGLHVDLVEMTDASWNTLPAAREWNRWLGEKLLVSNGEDSVQTIDKLVFSEDQRLLIGYSSESSKLLAWDVPSADSPASGVPRFEDAFAFGSSPDGRWLITAKTNTGRFFSIAGELKELFALPRPYRSNLGFNLAMASLSEGELLLAQPTDSHSVGLLKLKPNSARPVEELAEFDIPGGAKIKGVRLSRDASLLAVVTEHDGNYAVHLWELSGLNQSLQTRIGFAPLFVGPILGPERLRGETPFEAERLSFSSSDQKRSFHFETLERYLRALSMSNSSAVELQSMAPFDKGFTNALDKIGESDWESYFKEQIRTGSEETK